MQKPKRLEISERAERGGHAYQSTFRCNADTVLQLNTVWKYMEQNELEVSGNSDVIRQAIRYGSIYVRILEEQEKKLANEKIS